ncbi:MULTISPECIES: hypothetical protein [Chryseobacterium]|uniref:Uncharacterized protein n=1 Tax=Chryseobacterium salivictor TaxID=2547600 RepID=A0A4P6ZHG3_9FLAO|nr:MULTISPECIES: hypothetical protein [Chryseobacterium]MDQ0475662.1 hypothetical protein [Chryseobacterium sp. MDT2-18]QBO59089.1 hypothetical protein NBC122_02284 [Chryseobacterium salivictor]
MENPIIEIKKELIEWIKNLDDLESIQSLLELKNADQTALSFSDAQSEYTVKDDFDERFERGMTSKEFRRRIIQHIDSLPWEK